MRLDPCTPLTPWIGPLRGDGEVRRALWCCRDLTYAQYLWCTRCPVEPVVVPVDVYEPTPTWPVPYATYLRSVNEADRHADRVAALTTVLPAHSPLRIPTDMRTADARPTLTGAAALPRLGQVSPVEQVQPVLRVEATFRTNHFLGIGGRIDLMG